MGKFKDIFTELYKELFKFDINVDDRRAAYVTNPEERSLLTSKDMRKGKYFALTNQILIFNLLRDEPELLNDILSMARDDGFLVDSLYFRLLSKGDKVQLTIVHELSSSADLKKDLKENADEFEHIVVLREDVEEPKVKEDYLTGSMKEKVAGAFDRAFKRVFYCKSKKPSNNLKFLSYRVKKLIEERKKFYKAVGNTKSSLFLQSTEDINDMSEHDEVLSHILNFGH